MMNTQLEKQNPFTQKGFKLFLKRNAPLIVGSIIVYFILLAFFNYQSFVTVPAPRQLAWASNIIALIHGMAAFTMAVLFLTKNISVGSWMILVNITRAFTIYDIIAMLCFPETGSGSTSAFILHHIVLFTVTLFSFRHIEYIALGFLSELTQLPFYLSWYLLKWDMGGTVLFKVLAVLTLLTCFLLRVCLFSYIAYKLIKGYLQKKYSVTIREILIYLPLTFVNYYWFYLLVKKAMEQL